jgi:protein-arginine kinase activator protein McsA
LVICRNCGTKFSELTEKSLDGLSPCSVCHAHDLVATSDKVVKEVTDEKIAAGSKK